MPSSGILLNPRSLLRPTGAQHVSSYKYKVLVRVVQLRIDDVLTLDALTADEKRHRAPANSYRCFKPHDHHPTVAIIFDIGGGVEAEDPNYNCN